jgi:hypothetical protein
LVSAGIWSQIMSILAIRHLDRRIFHRWIIYAVPLS